MCSPPHHTPTPTPAPPLTHTPPHRCVYTRSLDGATYSTDTDTDVFGSSVCSADVLLWQVQNFTGVQKSVAPPGRSMFRKYPTYEGAGVGDCLRCELLAFSQCRHYECSTFYNSCHETVLTTQLAFHALHTQCCLGLHARSSNVRRIRLGKHTHARVYFCIVSSLWFLSELRSCVKDEVAVLSSPSLIILNIVSVDVRQHGTRS